MMKCNNEQILSLYIPVISNNTTHQYITNCFHKKNIGQVSRVDFVFNQQKNRKEAFIHFSEWYNTPEAIQLNQELDESSSTKKCKLVHHNEQFWPLLKNKNPLEKNSPERKSNEVYKIEHQSEVEVFHDRIADLEKIIKELSFMTKLHDANIRYIINRSITEPTLYRSIDMPPLKRYKSENVNEHRY